MTTTVAREDPEQVAAYVCEECDKIIPVDQTGPALYECGNCGAVFNRDNSADGDSHRCPDCGKFSGKIEDESCDECTGGAISEADAWECPECETLYATEDAARECCPDPDPLFACPQCGAEYDTEQEAQDCANEDEELEAEEAAQQPAPEAQQ